MPFDAQDLSRLSCLLEQALELTPAERAAWLAALPAEDHRYEAALLRMFEAEAEGASASFLSTLPRVAASPEAPDAQPGDLVGAYRLIRLVARGGMGSVWLAERADGALQRQVALKLPHLAWGAGLAERMARERDIGARLEHPHIARLYDAGVDHRGRPFLAFEFIDGVAIDQWCRTQRLSVRARLKLFVQVAQAVAYAHARLVVHRDLKPSNVLVTPDGQAHLLDFGIAKLLHDGVPEDAGATQRLGAAMTPHYASPEQLRGEVVTVASDVYSLGVLLYELLTGERPHAPRRWDLAGWQEVVLQAEPGLASKRVAARLDERALARALRGDLDAILVKALRRAPEQRYATVDALADDVQHHLAGEPVRARPATAGYRLGKLALRHTAASTAVATVALAAVAGTAVFVVQARRANDEAAQAQLVKQFVIDAFRASAQDDQADERSRASTLERLLERNAQLIARAQAPRLQAELYGIVAGMLLDAKAFGAAAQNARHQLGALEQVGVPRADLAAPRLLLSQALLSDGLAAEAEQQARDALALAPAGSPLAARARLQLAAALAAGGDIPAASEALDQVDAQLYAGGRSTLAERARAMALRAAILDARDQPEQAETLLTHAIETAEGTGGPPTRLATDLRLELARQQILRHHAEMAKAALGPALSALRAAGSGGTVEAALVQAEMAALMLYAGASPAELDEALLAVERSHDAIAAPEARASPLQRAWADAYAAAAALTRGHVERAQTLAADTGGVLLPRIRDPRARLHLLAVLAQAAVRAGPAAQADELLRDWLALAVARFPREAWKARLVGAEHLVNQARWDEADIALSAVADRTGSEGPPATADEARAGVAAERLRALLDRGMHAAALALVERGPPATDPAALAETLCAAGRPAAGLGLLDAAPMRVASHPYSPDTVRRQAVRGLCLLAEGDLARAATMARLARASADAQPGANLAYRRPLERLSAALNRSAGGAVKARLSPTG